LRWLYKLENKLGRYYIRRLAPVLVFAMAIVYLADLLIPGLGLGYWLSFSRALIFQGQVWRVLTFLIVPTGGGFLFIITLYFYYILGDTLENYWGGFRLNVYLLIGALGAIAAGFITGGTSNYYLFISLFLAVAAIAPDRQILMFFIIPVKFKWMALVYVVLMAAGVINGFLSSVGNGLQVLVSLAFSLLNYLIFFGPSLWKGLREQIRISRNRRNWRNNNR
jgi:hypothetical protein